MSIKQINFSLLMLMSIGVWGAGLNDNGDGTVTDFATGLVWQQSDSHNESRTWSEANDYCDNLSLAGDHDWRLPMIKELSSIVDDRQQIPAINLLKFPDIITFASSWVYWSASDDAANSERVWTVSFARGNIATAARAHKRSVRCVYLY